MISLDFPQLFQEQRKFEEKVPYNNPKARIKKNFLGAIIELSESANEKPEIFKYWSSNPKSSSLKTAEYYAEKYKREMIPIEKDTFLEELIDILHFLLIIGTDLEIDEKVTKAVYPIETEAEDLYLEFVATIAQLYTLWHLEQNERIKEIIGPNSILGTYKELLGIFVMICNVMGYKGKEIEEAYYRKNKINYERQANGY